MEGKGNGDGHQHGLKPRIPEPVLIVWKLTWWGSEGTLDINGRRAHGSMDGWSATVTVNHSTSVIATVDYSSLVIVPVHHSSGVIVTVKSQQWCNCKCNIAIKQRMLYEVISQHGWAYKWHSTAIVRLHTPVAQDQLIERWAQTTELTNVGVIFICKVSLVDRLLDVVVGALRI